MHLETPSAYFVHPVYWGSELRYTRSYRVSTTKALSGREQRSLLNNYVRRELIYDVVTRDQAESYYLKKYIKAHIHKVWGVPLWMYEMELSSQAASGQVNMLVPSTLYREVTVGEKVLLYSDYKTYETVEVSEITDEFILDSDNQDFSDGTLNEWGFFTNGNGNISYSAGPGSESTMLITVGGTPGTYTSPYLASVYLVALEYNHTYVLTTDIYLPSSNNNWTSIIPRFDLSGATYNVTVPVNFSTEDQWQTIETEVTTAYDLGGSILIDAFSTNSGDLCYVDNVSLTSTSRSRIAGATNLVSTWPVGTKVYPIMRSTIASAQEFGAKVPEIFAMNIHFTESYRGDSYA